MPKKTETAKPKRFIIENIEAIGTAIIVALLFKVFVLEISRIPSGSMQPTLMGDPQSQLFDRVLVDKFSFKMRDPERWEVVVFKHPLERSRIMVKRLVGMPGEHLRIASGDLWTRPDANAEWKVLRRSDKVMDEMWKRLDRSDFGDVEWSQTVGKGWRFEPGQILASGPGKARFRKGKGTSLQNAYHDGYPDELREASRGQAKHPYTIGDVRLQVVVRAEAGTTEVVLEILEGKHAAYSFRLPGPAAAAGAKSSIETRISGTPSTTEGLAWRLPVGSDVEVTAINLDDRLQLFVEGELHAEVEVTSVSDGGAYIGAEFAGAGGRIEDIRIDRDVHYIPLSNTLARTWTAEIPEGSYVMLGDNTQDSADSRDWKSLRYTYLEEGEEVSFRGNHRHTENPRDGRNEDGQAMRAFRNEWGDVSWFQNQERVPQEEGNAPLVARNLILGRALAVFWPIHRGRLTWLH